MTEKLTPEKLEQTIQELWQSIPDTPRFIDPRDYYMTPEEGRLIREMLMGKLVPDPSVPKGEIHLRQDGTIVAKIINIGEDG
jgi:hypothetical protein